MKCNWLSIGIGILVALGVLIIISGYNTSFIPRGFEGFSPKNFPYPQLSESIVKNKKSSCRPGFDCRRVGFYCSLIG